MIVFAILFTSLFLIITIYIGSVWTVCFPFSSSVSSIHRSLASGHRGEVYDINGDKVAVILDNVEKVFQEEVKNNDEKPYIWIDSKLIPSISIFCLIMNAYFLYWIEYFFVFLHL